MCSSSPAVGVINSSGRPAVVVGTGFGEKPPYKSDTDKLFAFYAAIGTNAHKQAAEKDKRAYVGASPYILTHILTPSISIYKHKHKYDDGFAIKIEEAYEDAEFLERSHRHRLARLDAPTCESQKSALS